MRRLKTNNSHRVKSHGKIVSFVQLRPRDYDLLNGINRGKNKKKIYILYIIYF